MEIENINIETENENVENSLVENDEKGTVTNPYTIAEYETMLEDGLWQGGYVEGIGLLEKDNEISMQDADSYYGEEGDIPHFEGSDAAVDRHHDCFYSGLGYIVGESPVSVADKFGAYLKKIHPNWSHAQINFAISQGIGSETYQDFMNFMKECYNKTAYSLTPANFCLYMANNPNDSFMGYGFIKIVVKDNVYYYHAVPFKKKSGGSLVFSDSQDPSRQYQISEFEELQIVI